MRLMTETTARRRVGVLTPIPTWIGRHRRELSDRVYAAGDECAHQQGWEVTKSTGRFGFGARSYRDPRFGDWRWQLGRQQIEGPTSGLIDANCRDEASNNEADR